MNVLVLTPYLYDTAPGQRFRIEQWARFLEPRGVHCQFVPFETPELKHVLYERSQFGRKLRALATSISRRVGEALRIAETWDVIYLYRELLPIGPPLLEHLLARRGIPIVYDFDDAIFLPAVSEANRYFRWLKMPQKTGTICRLSTCVVVGNPRLAAYSLQYASCVSVIPTTIDTDQYVPKEHVGVRGVPVIGWSGSRTTLAHLRTIVPALRTLRSAHRFRLHVIGSSGFAVEGLEVSSKDWSAQSEIADLKSFDVGLMPLPDDAWARGKCGLKALQYMALGVPVVASPVGVNTDIIEDGRNGFLASSHAEWVEKLLLLMSDEDLRERFARAGRKTVEERYSTKVQAPRLLKILEQVCKREPPQLEVGREDPASVGAVT